ncbi:MAG: beta-ketoacyl-ACP synthase III [Coriobacteriia bacterium]|nr:beta-ketoacyl-ACP synthase III [Coriobacteriia bacterium]
MTYAAITGIGIYLPERILTNDDLSRMVDTDDEWIVSRTGIRERRLAGPDEATSTMAAAAGAAAIADAGLSATDIDFLVVGTGSPDHIMPSTAALTQDLLGLRCGAVDVMAACTSFIAALQHGTSLIEAGRAARVLVIGADALTRHVDFSDRRTCVLFGDGAGAVILEASDEAGVLGIDLGADGSGAGVLSIPAGGSAAPCTAGRVEAGEHYLKMSGGEVFKFAVRIIPETTRRALESSGLTVEDLAWLVPHQANQRILDAVTPRLGIDPDRVFSNVELLGNTSAASIPLALHDLYTDHHLHCGDVVALVGFGAGLTWGAAVVRWTKGPNE